MDVVAPQSPHFRNFIAILYAVVIGVILVGTVDSISHSLYPPPADLDMNNQEQMKEYVKLVPTEAKLIIIFGWMLGIFIGGIFAGVFGENKDKLAGLFIAVFFLSMVVLMLVTIPSPVWFSATGMICIVLSALGAREVSRRVSLYFCSLRAREEDSSETLASNETP